MQVDEPSPAPDDLVEHLRALELELLTNTVRKDVQRLSELLADSFQEFGSSGRVYRKQDILDALSAEPPASLSLTGFQVQPLSATIVLVTYTSQKSGQDDVRHTALRSSLWRKDGGNWQMIFHQGTRIT